MQKQNHTVSSISEISWWVQQLEVLNGIQIITREADLVIETYASTVGWEFNYLFLQVKIGRSRESYRENLFINASELKAASIAVRSMTKDKER